MELGAGAGTLPVPIYERSGAKTKKMSHSDAATVLKDGRMRQNGLIKKNVLAFPV